MKTLRLTQGRVALIDDGDYDRVAGQRWSAVQRGYTWYAQGTVEGQPAYLHRIIVMARLGEEIDHINRDGLDCRRENLRKVTRTQNNANARKRRDGITSKYKGVYRHSQGRLWIAQVTVGGKKITRSCYSEADAARAYNEIALEVFGAHARINGDVS